jgi:hypothetical protein
VRVATMPVWALAVALILTFVAGLTLGLGMAA